jgi:anti-sigma factor RsiW
MKIEQQLNLQSYLDGEMPERERRDVAGWLERDGEARASLAQLTTVRTALTGNEPALALPESREFYWSKLEREIARLEREPARPPRLSLLAWLRRLLVPTAGLALLALAAAVFVWPQRAASGLGEFETSMADTGATTYRDHANGVTLVWLSYPATDHEIDYEAPPLAQAR